MKPTLLILAAGMGSRYGSLKQIDKFGPNGEAIIDYSIYDAIQAGFGKVVFIIRKSLEDDFREIFGKKLQGQVEVDYVFQELDAVPEGVSVPADRTKPWGTAHAVMVAAPKVNEPCAVINADDFYGADSFKQMADYLQSGVAEDPKNYCMVGYQLKNTLSDHGYVSRGICAKSEEGYLESIVERTHITKSEEGIAYQDGEGQKHPLTGEEVASMNFFGFHPSIFTHCQEQFTDFVKENQTNIKAEFFIPTVVNNLINSGEAQLKVLNTSAKWFGVTYKEDKEIAVERIKGLVEAGEYPEKLWK
ncbi:sugar phosphate nucleotidyltransferase [Rapidithrix thailandica]|uniref:Sugar phosphate nucleotidyltransferase n=1 Tax=Rapidithrix thailandica TaxID=413964 RepID=A0AAW9S0N4_9BACT